MTRSHSTTESARRNDAEPLDDGVGEEE